MLPHSCIAPSDIWMKETWRKPRQDQMPSRIHSTHTHTCRINSWQNDTNTDAVLCPCFHTHTPHRYEYFMSCSVMHMRAHRLSIDVTIETSWPQSDSSCYGVWLCAWIFSVSVPSSVGFLIKHSVFFHFCKKKTQSCKPPFFFLIFASSRSLPPPIWHCGRRIRERGEKKECSCKDDKI